MLTLPETIAAIKALDTPRDILVQACAAVLTKGRKVEDGEDMATLIMKVFYDLYDTSDLMIAGTIVSGKLGGLMSHPGKAGELLDGLHTVLTRAFHEALQIRLSNKLDKDPIEALDMLRDIAVSYKRVRGES